ncbi:hypothetical protein HNP38_001441 [Chryseobacterium defluvii]|uniref:Uncharacterized protein n=1 Tax=Chryseobacterium defluvii TaxID=160396 RepID=A0A840K9Y8_9FLAO|nr:hypothetical protein [Chryseobacterium defluvii]MBB4806169.1 hypothetical protein [Chryseobacterium defluvii]
MKKILFSLIVGLSATSVHAQINIPSVPQEIITGENAFLDASPYSAGNGWGPSESKGLVFPETDLAQFQFKTDGISPISFSNAFNGMIVYNTGTGTTADPALNTQTANLEPGFYYFYNPTGSSTLSVADGVWMPLGASSTVDIKTTETVTNISVAGAQVYARKGNFQTNGTSTSPISYNPDGPITIPNTATDGLYRVTIFNPNGSGVYSTTVYSYDTATGALITGSPNISVVLPSGDYPYTVEYFK